MLIRRKRSWEIPESAATPESVYFSRRDLIRAVAVAPAIAAVSPLGARAATPAAEAEHRRKP